MYTIRKAGTFALAIVLAFAMTGCLKIRQKATFTRAKTSIVYQSYAAVNDWREWATEIATRVNTAIKDRPDLAEKPIFMRPLHDRAFALGFYSLLHTELVSRGLQVSIMREEDAIVLSYATLPVSPEHDGAIKKRDKSGLTGAASSDTLARDDDFFDFFEKIGPAKDKAVILTVGMSYNNRYIMHASSVLKVSEEQHANFISPFERGYKVEEFPSRTIKVTGE